MIRRLLLLILIVVTTIAPSQAGTDDKGKASYLDKTEKEVQQWSHKLQSLQERSEKSGAETRDTLDRQLRHIDGQLAVARKKLETLRDSEEGSWDHFRKGLDETMRDIKRDYQKAVSFFNKNEPKEKS